MFKFNCKLAAKSFEQAFFSQIGSLFLRTVIYSQIFLQPYIVYLQGYTTSSNLFDEDSTEKFLLNNNQNLHLQDFTEFAELSHIQQFDVGV
ncbi:hypothetical protein [Mucilaginibacter lacusdianchii]|uniref:hypothetical protein n=1 Tax=Mucilaginibacter lacusdianchii TaxID=2684211 RepID=UPI00131D5892|nr:hypothetical protein [Mucilaginibacter sp. JXJ CY 39]